ncbi:hypothetical protein FACS1894190_08230 [Spirochaetia bacterium]|nr:hypothetical protein FACS1894190_08230 [Spirochaetia bacterium]
MKFYDIDDALDVAITQGDKPLRIKLEIDLRKNGEFVTVPEFDILQADFYGLKEVAGGTTARGEILLNNLNCQYVTNQGYAAELRVYFTVGEGLSWVHRFTLFVNDQGFQDIREGRRRMVRLVLRDRSAALQKSDENRDWSTANSFTYITICDKSQPENSLLHLIAKRAGLQTNDIDCCTIPLTLPYVKLTKNIWAELSALATAYRCHLECATEKPLVFAHSPYQIETLQSDEDSYFFTGENIYYLRETERADQYRNTVRLKINLPVSLQKQTIWQYTDTPVLYMSSMAAYYPFRENTMREIEYEGYEAHYIIRDETGKERNVIYADNIDTKEEAEARLSAQGGQFNYGQYDVSTNHDKALVTLEHDGDSDLINASIFGRPIVLDINRSCFGHDDEAVTQYGTCSMNVTGTYFSGDDVDGKPQYEDWVARELSDRLIRKHELTIKTHRAVFHARIGATVQVHTVAKNYSGVVNALSYHFKKGAAFSASFKLEVANGQ